MLTAYSFEIHVYKKQHKHTHTHSGKVKRKRVIKIYGLLRACYKYKYKLDSKDYGLKLYVYKRRLITTYNDVM